MRTDTARVVLTILRTPDAGGGGSWEAQVHCRGPLAWMWDDALDDEVESPQARRARHTKAAQVCATCPALQACAAAVTDQDSGVWAGRLVGADQCTDCGFPMTRHHSPRRPGTRRHAAHGRCHSCFKHARKHPEMVDA